MSRALHTDARSTPRDIVVIDNASSDGSVDVVRRRWPDVRVVALASNVGFAAANNIGFRESRGELVLLLNSDTVAPLGAIDRLVSQILSMPDVAIIGPRLTDARGEPELSFGRMLGPWSELGQKLLGSLAKSGWSPARARLRTLTSRAGFVDWVSGACLLVRRADAETVGLLDERYFMYCEDVDFCAAVRARGRRVYFTPQVGIVHLRGRSGPPAPGVPAHAYRRSQLAFYQKHHPPGCPFFRAYLGLRGKLPPSSSGNT